MRAHFGLPSVVGEINEGKVPRLTYVLHIRILNLELPKSFCSFNSDLL